MAKYRVFTKKGCGTCLSVKNVLKSKSIEFEEIDVATREGLELAQAVGITHSGAIIDENNRIIPLAEVV